MVLTGLTVVDKWLGCAEGAGQDYSRLESPGAVIELHPAFNTATAFTKGRAAVVTVDTVSIGTGFTFLLTGLTVSRATAGVTFDDIICSLGGSSIALHLVKGQAAIWTVGTILNFGVVLT